MLTQSSWFLLRSSWTKFAGHTDSFQSLDLYCLVWSVLTVTVPSYGFLRCDPGVMGQHFSLCVGVSPIVFLCLCIAVLTLSRDLNSCRLVEPSNAPKCHPEVGEGCHPEVGIGWGQWWECWKHIKEHVPRWAGGRKSAWEQHGSQESDLRRMEVCQEVRNVEKPVYRINRKTAQDWLDKGQQRAFVFREQVYKTIMKSLFTERLPWKLRELNLNETEDRGRDFSWLEMTSLYFPMGPMWEETPLSEGDPLLFSHSTGCFLSDCLTFNFFHEI